MPYVSYRDKYHQKKRDAERAAEQEQTMSDETTELGEPEQTPEPAATLPALDPSQMALVMAIAQQIGTQLAQAFAQVQGSALTAEQMAEVYARANSAAMKVALRPENQDPPLVSAFNPDGDRDHPRPEPRCEFYLQGVALARAGDPGTHTVEELSLLNLLEPGQYRVDKADGSQVLVFVEPTYAQDGEGYARLNINLGANTREKAQAWPSLVALLRQMVGPLAGTVPARPPVSRLPVGRISRAQPLKPGMARDMTDAVIAEVSERLTVENPQIAAAFKTALAREVEPIPAAV